MFIKQNLSPDRLAGFDIEDVKNLKDCEMTLWKHSNNTKFFQEW